MRIEIVDGIKEDTKEDSAEKEDNKDKDTYKDIYILGIETSCDDTCAAVVKNGSILLSNIVSSQEEIHRKYGGT